MNESELLHFAVELFPRFNPTPRNAVFKAPKLHELWRYCCLNDSQNDSYLYENHFLNKLSFAHFKSASGRQLSGNHRMTAFIRCCDNSSGLSDLNERVEHNSVLSKAIFEIYHETTYASANQEWPPSDQLDALAIVLPKVIEHIEPEFVARCCFFNQLNLSDFINEHHLLFISDADLEASNICLSYKQTQAFLAGNPIFLSPLRLFKDQQNSRGRQSLTALEKNAQKALAVWIYKYKHFLSGFYNNSVRSSVTADSDSQKLLMEVLQRNNIRGLKQKKSAETVSQLGDYLKIAGETIRGLAGLKTRKDQLDLGRAMNELGKQFNKNDRQSPSSRETLEWQIGKVALLLERAGLMQEDVETYSNSEQRFGKPIPQSAREMFAAPATALTEVLFEVQTSSTTSELDIWTQVAFETAVNPALFWPSAWPLILHFHGAIGIGRAIRGKNLDDLSIDEILGIEVILNDLEPKDTVLWQSRDLLRQKFPTQLINQFNSYFSPKSGHKIVQLDEKAKLDVAEFIAQKLTSGGSVEITEKSKTPKV